MSSRSEKKKLDEDLVELSNTVDELTSASGEAAVQRLQDEINDSKAILKCGVCLDRPKEVCSCILFCFGVGNRFWLDILNNSGIKDTWFHGHLVGNLDIMKLSTFSFEHGLCK